jgi:hypothetical protein
VSAVGPKVLVVERGAQMTETVRCAWIFVLEVRDTFATLKSLILFNPVE